MDSKTVNIPRDFSRFPAGRYRSHGNFSGEVFRETYLEPALKQGQTLVIELDGGLGYGSSFLEEAFGGAVRSTGLTPKQVEALLVIRTSDPSLDEEIKEYIRHALAK